MTRSWFLALAVLVITDTAFTTWALRDPTDGGNVGGGLGLIVLLALSLPWSVAYLFLIFVDEDSLVAQVYPLLLGLAAAVNLAIVWFRCPATAAGSGPGRRRPPG